MVKPFYVQQLGSNYEPKPYMSQWKQESSNKLIPFFNLNIKPYISLSLLHILIFSLQIPSASLICHRIGSLQPLGDRQVRREPGYSTQRRIGSRKVGVNQTSHTSKALISNINRFLVAIFINLQVA